MRDGLELQEFLAQLARVNVEGARRRRPLGEGFGEEVVVSLWRGRESCGLGSGAVAGRALRCPSSLELYLADLRS